jgi:hypothetical protein
MARYFSNEPRLRSPSVVLRSETKAMDSSNVSSHHCSNTHQSAEVSSCHFPWKVKQKDIQLIHLRKVLSFILKSNSRSYLKVHRTYSGIIIIWFVSLLALRPLLAYCASLGWQWRWVWRSRWNVDWQGKPKFSEKETCSNATFVHHKIPHDQTRVWTWAAAVGTRRLFFFYLVCELLALRPLLA